MYESNIDRPKVTLTPRELEALDAEISHEIQRLGPPPTVNHLRREGYSEEGWLNWTLDAISGVGRIITLLVVEIIQSGGALVIGVFFAILEYWRVYDGARALGQSDDQARLISYAVVAANVIVPIMLLRQLRGRKSIKIRHRTLRGYWEDFTNRITGKTWVEEADAYYNPILSFATALVTYLTIMIAVYDLLKPLITSIFEGTEHRPIPVLVIELVMGIGLSLVGVFFLQSAAHAIGARSLSDNPRRLTDLLDARRVEYDQRVEAVRLEIRARHEAAKAERLEGLSTKRLPAVSKTTKDNGKRRNPNARQDFADWFNSQSPEVREDIVSGAISLRKAGEEAGVDKEIVRRHIDTLRTPKVSPNSNGDHAQ